jgi:mannose-1-phosphate guanylyltransferase
VVDRSAVLPGASIEAGAEVRGSIVGPRARVGAGARVEALSVVGDDVVVEPEAHLTGARVPEVA